MTLDERLHNDIEELKNKKEISAAVKLAEIIKPKDAKSDSHRFSTRGVPHYYYGKRDKDTSTVVVNLNPGKAAKLSDEEFEIKYYTKLTKQPIDLFIEDYHKAQGTYETKDGNAADSFDVKQAAFLTPWKDSGIGLPSNPDWDDSQTRNTAAQIVVSNKLQLELVPYASAKFDFRSSKVNLLFPYVDTILDEIFAQKRTYIIFASRKFEYIFKRYNMECKNIFEFPKYDKTEPKTEPENRPLKDGGTLKGKCKVIYINYNGERRKALIAHTFPSQALSRAFKLMQTYGEICYKEWCNK